MNVLMISGSRNPQGQTARAADAVSTGVTEAGGSVDPVYLPVLKIERCRQCRDNGWGLCRDEGACVIEDDFAGLVERLADADGVIVATPVYFSDLSESLRAFLDRLRRISRHENGRRPIEGKPAVGVCVAGGGGGGAPHCCLSLEKVLATCGFDVADMIPVRRQNLDAKRPALKAAGQFLAESAGKP